MIAHRRCVSPQRSRWLKLATALPRLRSNRSCDTLKIARAWQRQARWHLWTIRTDLSVLNSTLRSHDYVAAIHRLNQFAAFEHTRSAEAVDDCHDQDNTLMVAIEAGCELAAPVQPHTCSLARRSESMTEDYRTSARAR
jgi:hypothetical protein